MNVLTLKIELLEPLLVSQPETGEENSSVSCDYIPGSALRGVFLQAYLQHVRLGILDLQKHTQAHHLFFKGGLRFLNAYPARPGSLERMQPCPLAWLVPKTAAGGQSFTVYDYSLEDPRLNQAVKPPKGRFYYRDGEQVVFASVQMQSSAHNSSVQRDFKQSGNSTVYRYEAIAPGQVFIAEVLSADADILEQAAGWLEGKPITIGGSATAGFGRVDVSVQGIRPREAPVHPAVGEKTIITFTSDVILRTRDGQNSADFDRALGEALGMSAPPAAERSFQQLHLVGGFNRKWGLPLPQSWALKAGSTFVYPAGSLDMDALRTLQEQGIGERVVEGFGEFMINPPSAPRFEAQAAEGLSFPDVKPVELSAASRELAQRMAERMLRASLDQRLVAAVNRISIERPPQKTQLSRLRVAVQKSLAQGDLSAVRGYLDNLKGSREQFERARVTVDGKPSLDEWIIKITGQPDIRSLFELQEADLPRAAGLRGELTAEIQVEYTARLLDGLLRKTVKQLQAQEEGVR
ncbi:MAG: hypothetical protein GX495_02035 [Chloroflexi bacterium]|nr:hypothetical protein [Chloroflexota bacterium]